MSNQGTWEYYGGLGMGQPGTTWGLAENWREVNAQLFQFAGQVQEKLNP